MILDRHWWRTRDGRLVPDGDPDARFLAFPRGHDVPELIAEKTGLAAAVKRHVGDAKQAAPQEDKMAGRPPDKSARQRKPSKKAESRASESTEQE